MRIDHGTEPRFTEGIADWRRWSRRFLGTVGLAQHIAAGQRVRPDDAEDVFAEIPEWRDTLDLLRRPPRPSVEMFIRNSPDGDYQPYEPPAWEPPTPLVQVHAIQSWLNTLMVSAGVRRRVQRDPKRLSLELVDGVNPACPLFSALVLELAMVCTGVQSQARCRACRKAFQPRTQLEKYCAACRRSGARLRLAQQKLRDTRRARGLTARGTMPQRGRKS
jgi:hypothetical protein